MKEDVDTVLLEEFVDLGRLFLLYFLEAFVQFFFVDVLFVQELVRLLFIYGIFIRLHLQHLGKTLPLLAEFVPLFNVTLQLYH